MTVRADGDDVLLRAVAQGDRDALEALYRRHAPWLMARLTRRCADPGLVEEVVQDTFVAVWRGAGRYRATGEVAAWIWGIGIRRLIDRLRRTAPGADGALRDDGLVVRPRTRSWSAWSTATSAPRSSRLSPELRAVVQATVLDGLHDEGSRRRCSASRREP